MSLILENREHVDDVLSTLHRMRTLGDGCDAVLAAEDGAMLRVHKSVLSWCSPYFRILFTTSLLPECTCRSFVVVPNVSSAMLEAIVRYAYSGTTPVSEECVAELIPAADQFNVKGLVKQCTEFLVAQLDPCNCLGIWTFGKEFFLPHLETEAFRFALNHFPQVSESSQEFLELSAEDLQSLLQEDGLNVERELMVWNAICRWCRFDSPGRLKHLPDLLARVRMATMTLEDFQSLSHDPMVLSDRRCISLVARLVLRDLGGGSTDMKESELAVLQPRLPHTLLFCFGGWSHFGPTYSFEVYDCRLNSWKVKASEPLEARVYHQCVSLDKYIYVIGGSNGYVTMSACFRYHTERMSHETVAPMHEKRCYLSAAVVDGRIYAMGGFDGDDERSKTMEYFDPERNQWTYGAAMYARRSDAGCCGLRSRIFVAGGFDGRRYLRSAEVYYVPYDQWSFLPDMNSPRSGVRCAALGNDLYIVGGCDGMRRLRSVEKYDVTNGQWVAAKPMRRPRSNYALEVMENKIYVMGGYDEATDATTEECECFDPTTLKWTCIAPMNLKRSGLDACAHAGLTNVCHYTMGQSLGYVLSDNILGQVATPFPNIALPVEV